MQQKPAHLEKNLCLIPVIPSFMHIHQDLKSASFKEKSYYKNIYCNGRNIYSNGRNARLKGFIKELADRGFTVLQIFLKQNLQMTTHYLHIWLSRLLVVSSLKHTFFSQSFLLTVYYYSPNQCKLNLGFPEKVQIQFGFTDLISWEFLT